MPQEALTVAPSSSSTGEVCTHGAVGPRRVRTARAEAADWFEVFLQEAEEEAESVIAAQAAASPKSTSEDAQPCSTGSMDKVAGLHSSNFSSCAAAVDLEETVAMPADIGQPSVASGSAAVATAGNAVITDTVGTRPTKALSRPSSSTKLAQAIGHEDDAAAPIPLILEEMHNEREMWEARTRQLLMGKPSSSEAVGPSGSARVLSPVAQRMEPSKGEARAESEVCVAAAPAPEKTDVLEVTMSRDETVAAVVEEPDTVEGGLIAAALKAAGLEPGPLLLGGLEARNALHTVSEVPENTASDDESAVNGLAVGPTEDSGGASRWAMSARQWAQQRLKRKKGRAPGSRAGTP